MILIYFMLCVFIICIFIFGWLIYSDYIRETNRYKVDLDYMRKEVQRLIDKYEKGGK